MDEFRFVGSDKGEILKFDSDFQKEAFYRYLETNGLDEDTVLEANTDYDEDIDTDDDCYIAHKFSSKHRTELEKDKVCGCFDCLRIFSPSEIEEWVPETPDGECVTAVCPYCGDDSIIGESSGYPITKEFLKKMHDRWMCQA